MASLWRWRVSPVKECEQEMNGDVIMNRTAIRPWCGYQVHRPDVRAHGDFPLRLRVFTVYIQSLFSLMLLVFSCGFVAGQEAKPRLLVLPFENSSSIADAGIQAADAFIRELFNTGRFEMVKPTETLPLLIRKRLGSIDVDERNLAREIGGQVQAAYILIGSLVVVKPQGGGETGERSKQSQVQLAVRLIDLHPGTTKWMATRTLQGFGGMDTGDLLRSIAADMVRSIFESLDAQFPPYKPGKCVNIDIRTVCNMGFEDDAPENNTGGWTDDGTNDMRTLPVGVQELCGVPFAILDPKSNGGKSCIVLKGQMRPRFPETTGPIEVGRNVKALYFLHTLAWGEPFGHKAGTYSIEYADGLEEEIQLIAGSNIGDWWNAGPLPRARLAWKGTNTHKHEILRHVGIHLFRWENPSPDRGLKSFTLTSAGRSVPILIAVTAELAEGK